MPARGVERWLTQRLSHRLGVGARGGDGVCAGVDFLTPALAGRRCSLDRDADDPWSPDRLAWPLLDGHRRRRSARPWCATLAPHLGGGDPADEPSSARPSLRRRAPPGRPVLLVRRRSARPAHRLARGPRHRRRRRSARRRPALAGRAVAAPARVVDAPPPDERHARRMRAAARGRRPTSTCPTRLSLFGHTRLPATQLALLSALGELREVHLWLPQASAVALGRAGRGRRQGRCRAPTTRPPTVVGHRCWPRSAATRASCSARSATCAEQPSRHRRRRAATRCSAGCSRTFAPTAPPGHGARRARRATTTGVQVHACHGAARQVDVLREVLRRPARRTTRPSSRATSWSCAPTSRPTRRSSPRPSAWPSRRRGAGTRATSSASASPTARSAPTNPLLALAAQLVELVRRPDDREPGARPRRRRPVRARFGLDDEELERITRWVDAAGIRWGLDAAAPRRLRPRPARRRTPGAGLDRLLLGAAMAGYDTATSRRTLPLDDVERRRPRPGRPLRRARRAAARLHRPAPSARTTVTDWTSALGEARPPADRRPRRPRPGRSAQFDRELAAHRRRRRRRGHDAAAGRRTRPAAAAARAVGPPGPTSAPAR